MQTPSDTLFRRIYESNMVGLVFADQDGRIVRANKAFLDLVGYNEADIASGQLNWKNLTPPEFLEMSNRSFDELMRNGTMKPMEKQYVRKDGNRVDVLLGATRVQDPLAATVAYVVDFSNRKNIEDRLHASNQALGRDVVERTSELEEAYGFLDSLVENLPNMVFVKDAQELRFVRMNKAGESLLGVDRKQLLGKNDYDLFPEEQANFFTEIDRQVLESGNSIEIMDEALQTPQGLRYLHTKKVPILGRDGSSRYLLGISEDITDRKQAETEQTNLIRAEGARAEAERSLERMRFLAEASKVLNSSLEAKKTLINVAELSVPRFADWCTVMLKSEDDRIEVAALANSDPAQASAGREWAQRFPISLSDEFGPGKVLRTGEAEWMPQLSDEVLVKSARGAEHLQILRTSGLLSFLSIPLRSRDRILGVLNFATSQQSGRTFTESDLHLAVELAERAGLAIENAFLFEQVQSANRMKDEFLATLSHELRTPLTVIQGYADLLSMDGESMTAGERMQSYDMIRRNVRNQTQIIGDLLDSSAIVMGQMSYSPAPTDSTRILEVVCEGLQSTADARGVSLRWDLSKMPLLQADPARLQQIFWNLIANALKFTPREGEVRVRLYRDQGEAIMEVQDTGIGIDSHFLPHVFDRFRQEDNSSSRRYGGLGLGLSIVKQLTELHGGYVEVTSDGRNQGSLFTAHFPLPKEKLEPAPRDVIPIRPMSLTSKLTGLDILLVEDSPDTQEIARKILARAGAHVEAVSSTAEARHKLKTFSPSIIVSDIGLPGENGIHFIQRLREAEASTGQFTPAIALSAYVRPEEKSQALAAGFQGHVSKPIMADQLIDSILGAVSRDAESVL